LLQARLRLEKHGSSWEFLSKFSKEGGEVEEILALEVKRKGLVKAA